MTYLVINSKNFITYFFLFLLFCQCSHVFASEYAYQAYPDTEFGSSDASTAISFDHFILVGDDEANALRLYPKDGGNALKEWPLTELGANLKKELDIEGSVLLNNTLYIIGSHSNKSNGKSAQKHTGHLLSIKIGGTAPNLEFGELHQYSNLADLLVKWDSHNLHLMGEDRLNLFNAIKNGQIPESIHGFSIEGMTVTQDKKSLLLGFRAPLIEKEGELKALIIPINLPKLNTELEISSIEQPWLLNLGNRGIRDIFLTKNNQYLILAGPAESTDWDRQHNFALFTWNGNLTTPPVNLNVDLDGYLIQSKGSFETIADVEYDDATMKILLLMDNGDSIFEGESVKSKKNLLNRQQFLGTSISISMD